MIRDLPARGSAGWSAWIADRIFATCQRLTDDESRHDQVRCQLVLCGIDWLRGIRDRNAAGFGDCRRSCRRTHGVAAERATSAAGKKRAVNGRAVDFHRDIQPIFVKHCYACHGHASGIGLAARSARPGFAGGESGPVIVRGHSDESLLIQYVTGKNDAGIVMPPEGKARR